MRKSSSGLRGDERAEALEAGADALRLLRGRLDERQAQAADVVAASRFSAALIAIGFADDLQQLVCGRELLVDLLRARGVAAA